MKGAILVSTCGALFEASCVALADAWPSLARVEGVAQVGVPGGGLFNLYSEADPRWEWLPDTAGLVEGNERLVGCAIECRSEVVVAEAVALIAAAIDDPVWLIDGDGVVWPADGIDVSSVVL